jgi:hypothetical protein
MKPVFRATLVVLAGAFAIWACGTGSEDADAGPDATADATKDATNDATVDTGRDAGADAGQDSPADALSDVLDGSCDLDVFVVARCHELDAGYCFDYNGNWAPDGAEPYCPESGTLEWDAACPSQGRTGSCYSDPGGYGLALRCYSPITPQQCLGICLIVDGGFCP